MLRLLVLFIIKGINTYRELASAGDARSDSSIAGLEGSREDLGLLLLLFRRSQVVKPHQEIELLLLEVVTRLLQFSNCVLLSSKFPHSPELFSPIQHSDHVDTRQLLPLGLMTGTGIGHVRKVDSVLFTMTLILHLIPILPYSLIKESNNYLSILSVPFHSCGRESPSASPRRTPRSVRAESPPSLPRDR